MKRKPFYLFYGIGSEYVLHPLYSYFKEHKYLCHEIHISNKDNVCEKLSSVPKNCILITSSHFAVDQFAFNRLYSANVSGIVSLVELITLLKPKKTVYYPHDLSEPLIKDERHYLPLIDLALLPTKDYIDQFKHVRRSEVVGWIKLSAKNFQVRRCVHHSAIWFVSDIEYFKLMGTEAMEQQVGHVLNGNRNAMKFPDWPGVDEFEKYFQSRGVTVYPSISNVIDLIASHDYIVTNGLSSVTREAVLMGKPVVNLLENYLCYGLTQKKLFGSLTGVYFSRYDTFGKIDLTSLKGRPNRAKLFDFEKAEELICETV